MPIYTWVRTDLESDEQVERVEVIRSFDDYEVPPNDDEYPEASRHTWERQMPGGTTVRRPWSWGSKGNWMYPAIIIGEILNEVSKIS